MRHTQIVVQECSACTSIRRRTDVQPVVEDNTRNQCDKWGLPLKISQRIKVHSEAAPLDQQVNDAFLADCMSFSAVNAVLPSLEIDCT